MNRIVGSAQQAMTRTVGLLSIVLCPACATPDEPEESVDTDAQALPARGVTPTLLARATFPPFHVKSAAEDFKFHAKADPDLDIVVRRHDYEAGSTTGWHRHPGPVFITVVSGEVTFYDYDDPTCTGTVVGPGQGYVDDGHGHIGRNESGEPATDISVITAPQAGAFRIEIDEPSPHCDFVD